MIVRNHAPWAHGFKFVVLYVRKGGGMFNIDLLVVEQIKKRKREEVGRRLQIPIPEPELKPKPKDEPKRVIIIEL